MDTDPKETLGFNPDTGEYIEGSGEDRLIPLPPPEKTQSITPETQEAFRALVKKSPFFQSERTSRIVPERLFCSALIDLSKTEVVPRQGHFMRSYDSIPEGDNFSENYPNRSLFIDKNPQGFLSVQLYLRREYRQRSPDHPHFRVHFSIRDPYDYSETQTNSMEVVEEQGRRMLRLEYNDDKLASVEFQPLATDKPAFYLSEGDIATLLGGGELRLRPWMEEHYNLAYDKKGEVITVSDKEGENIIAIPTAVDVKDKFTGIVPRALVEDPIGADPREDYWKTAELKHTFGIDWQRPN